MCLKMDTGLEEIEENWEDYASPTSIQTTYELSISVQNVISDPLIGFSLEDKTEDAECVEWPFSSLEN